LAFPSNDFGEQEQMTGLQLETFSRIQQQVTFPVYKREHVDGDYCDPLFKFLDDKRLNEQVNVKPLWNFHKYLVKREGQVVDYFYSVTSPQAKRLTAKIERLIST